MDLIGSRKWLSESKSILRNTDPHVIIAMSGGVDSAVAAKLLVDAGFRCSALFMKNWYDNNDLGNQSCSWEDDVADALAVCETLKIDINTVDLSQDYWNRVFEDFLSEYNAGRTPNPDVLCNREIKFDAFLREARSIGGDLIATGHYAGLSSGENGLDLMRGKDKNKDQTYFLHSLQQKQLNSSLFPLAFSYKKDVRKFAEKIGFDIYKKKDSTGICFVGKRNFRDFLGQFIQPQNGPIVTTDGRVIGEHNGAVYYTLGQREGLGIGGVRGAENEPWFVARKDLQKNTLVVVQGHKHPALLSASLIAENVSWVAGASKGTSFKCTAQVRHRQNDKRCTVQELENDQVTVNFETPIRAVTPGQSVVFYDGNICLGGGIIAETLLPNSFPYT